MQIYIILVYFIISTSNIVPFNSPTSFLHYAKKDIYNILFMLYKLLLRTIKNPRSPSIFSYI